MHYLSAFQDVTFLLAS
jgi:hypothetical protein